MILRRHRRGPLLRQRYPAALPAELAIPIITAVASALDHAHRKGLLHRDVKPANIIVADLDTDEQRVLLADLGIARPVDDISGITATNMPVGSVAYAAPEQHIGEQMDGRADHADDLYAVVADKLDIGQWGLGAQGWPHAASDSTTDS